MNISIILAHPNPQSFNHAIAHTAATILQQHGHHRTFHDRYAEHFDPLFFHAEFLKGAPLPPEIAAHCKETVGCALYLSK